MALDLLGSLVLIRGEEAQAHRYFEENLKLILELKWISTLTCANSLAGFVTLVWRQSEHFRAARLLAALEKHFDTAQAFSAIFLLGTMLAEICSQCRDPQFAAAQAEGRAMTMEQTADFALQSAAPPASHTERCQPQAMQPLVEPLSKRELEVVRLLAQGLSNAQIAQALYLSVATVKVHTRNIYGKLGVKSRTQAIAQAHQLNLL